MLAFITLARAGVIPYRKSSVSVKHVGKDFSYSIEETHGVGLDPSSNVQQPSSMVSTPPEVSLLLETSAQRGLSTGPIISMPDAVPIEQVVEGESTDVQSDEQTVQIIPDSELPSQTLNSIAPMESDIKTMPIDSNKDSLSENNVKSLDIKKEESSEAIRRPTEEELKSVFPLPIIIPVYSPNIKTSVSNNGIRAFVDHQHEQLNVDPSSNKVNHHFQPFQSLGYYYPFGMVRMV